MVTPRNLKEQTCSTWLPSTLSSKVLPESKRGTPPRDILFVWPCLTWGSRIPCQSRTYSLTLRMACCWQGCWKSFNSGEKLSPVGEDNGGGGVCVCVCSMCAFVHVVCVSSHAWQHQDVWCVVCVRACVYMCACVHHVCVYVSSHAWQHQNVWCDHALVCELVYYCNTHHLHVLVFMASSI